MLIESKYKFRINVVTFQKKFSDSIKELSECLCESFQSLGKYARIPANLCSSEHTILKVLNTATYLFYTAHHGRLKLRIKSWDTAATKNRLNKRRSWQMKDEEPLTIARSSKNAK